MHYFSTRGQSPKVSFSEAVAIGLAPDGGLYLPETLPDLSDRLVAWEGLSYPQLTAAFLRLFATDLDPVRLKEIVLTSYLHFDHPEVAPLHRLDDHTWVLELFHGPTLAFKDFALQLLGNLYEEQIRRTGRPINVLGATSGDTGAAAIHGLLGKMGVSVFILYPDGRVSPLQESQMTRTGADTVFPLAIQGNFDDAQRALKEVFGDQSFREEVGLSAVNSINIARILAQAAYYLYAWLKLPVYVRTKATFIVPSGNFGNVLAGWMLSRMGVPFAGFQVATNQNDILYRFFREGVYQVETVHPSLAPSMDIQVASNFERFLYYAVNGDTAEVRRIMNEIRVSGSYRMEGFQNSWFTVSRLDDGEIPGKIKEIHDAYDYLVDPHTACAFAGFSKGQDDQARVMVATAHPAKFPATIEEATGIHPRHPSLDALAACPEVKYPLAPEADAIRAFIRAHRQS